MKAATARYSSKPIQWSVGAPPADSRPMTVVLFSDGSEAAEVAARTLEDRRVVKFHERCAFVKIDYHKDAPEAKAWNVSCVPTLILLDHAKEFGPKSSVERSAERICCADGRAVEASLREAPCSADVTAAIERDHPQLLVRQRGQPG